MKEYKSINMKTFETNIVNIYGNQGKVWLDDLPRIVDELAGKYGLSDLKPVENLSYSLTR
jgi:streptomycin 6-kinase